MQSFDKSDTLCAQYYTSYTGSRGASAAVVYAFGDLSLKMVNEH